MDADSEERERTVHAFKQAWQTSDDVPDISHFLEVYTGEKQSTLLLELVAVDIEYRYKRFPSSDSSQIICGLPANPEVNDYIERFDALHSDPELTSCLVVERDRIAKHAKLLKPKDTLLDRSLQIVGLAYQHGFVSYDQIEPLLRKLFSEESVPVELSLVEMGLLSKEEAELLESLARRLLQQREHPNVFSFPTLLNLWYHSDKKLRHELEGHFQLDQDNIRYAEEVCRQLAFMESSLSPTNASPRRVLSRSGTSWSISDTKPMSPQEIFVESDLNTQMRLPRRFGDYLLLCELGRGGMGVVYQAKQLTAGERIVALKVIRMDHAAVLDHESHTELINRFRNEICSTSILDNDYTVKIYDVGEVESQVYFAMQYVGGKSLGDLLNEGPVAPELAAKYVRHIALALSYAHQSNIIHRDIKPHNILVNNQNDRAMLADFGLARVNNPDMRVTQSFAAIGTAPYMSPEQILDSHSVDNLSDIYSLGATLYHLLTGRPPRAIAP